MQLLGVKVSISSCLIDRAIKNLQNLHDLISTLHFTRPLFISLIFIVLFLRQAYREYKF